MLILMPLKLMPYQQKISSDTNCGMPQTLANKMIFWDHNKNLFWCAMKPTRYTRKLLDPKTNFLTNKKKCMLYNCNGFFGKVARTLKIFYCNDISWIGSGSWQLTGTVNSDSWKITLSYVKHSQLSCVSLCRIIQYFPNFSQTFKKIKT